MHPEPDYYLPICQRVYGLGPADTDNATNFRKAWNKIRNEVKRDMVPLVAHNARFGAPGSESREEFRKEAYNYCVGQLIMDARKQGNMTQSDLADKISYPNE